MTLYTNLAAVAALAVTALSSGDFVNADIPAWRGDGGTSYYGWESFTVPYGGDNLPDSGDTNAFLLNSVPGAFITGGGNLYGMNGLALHVVGYDSSVDQAVLNLATMGTQFDYDTITMRVQTTEGYTYFDADDFAINYQESLGDQGDIINASLHFDLSSFDGDLLEWSFTLNGNLPHISLDALTVDIATAPIPAPAPLTLLGIAGIARRRRGM